MIIKTKKIPGVTPVERVKLLSDGDKRPLRGKDYFDIKYPNIFCLAKKNSGKTTVISTILKKCSYRNTRIVVFCPTVNSDETWISIRHSCESSGIPFVSHLSITEEGVDLLNLYVDELKKKNDPQDEEEEENPFITKMMEEIEQEKKKDPKYKFIAPDIIFIFDDISIELKKSSSIESLVKMNRHFKVMTIISSQHFNDLKPACRTQEDFYLIFKGLTLDKLKKFYDESNLAIDFEDFYKIYLYATKRPYSFLYVNKAETKFRMNFDSPLLIQNGIYD